MFGRIDFLDDIHMFGTTLSSNMENVETVLENDLFMITKNYKRLSYSFICWDVC